jgi:outer membrane protein assembly factor BamA
MEIGPVVGIGPRWGHYHARHSPFTPGGDIYVMYAPTDDRFGVEAELRVFPHDDGGMRLTALASAISLTRFNGYANESPVKTRGDINRVWASRYQTTIEWLVRPTAALGLGVGPTLEYNDPETRRGSAAQLTKVPGAAAFGVGGFAAEADLDLRDSRQYPRHGLRLLLHATGYPVTWGTAPTAFERADFTATGYLPLSLPLETILAVRAGGERVWGDAPFQEAAFIGGPDNVRGYEYEHFAGQAALYANAELRSRIARIDLFSIKSEVGTIALADVGRVFVNGERSNQWHSAFGGGLWLRLIKHALVGSVVYAYGDTGTAYATLGMPF